MSQYPHEREVAFSPHAATEARGEPAHLRPCTADLDPELPAETRITELRKNAANVSAHVAATKEQLSYQPLIISGAVVLPVCVHATLVPMTIEAVIDQRRMLLEAICDIFTAESNGMLGGTPWGAVASAMFEAMHAPASSERFEGARGALTRPPEWYHDDKPRGTVGLGRFQEAVTALIDMRALAVGDDRPRLEWLITQGGQVVTEGLQAATSCLGRSWGSAEANKALQAAVNVLTSTKLDHDALVNHASGIVGALTSPSAKVHISCLYILRQLDAQYLPQYVPRIVAAISKSGDEVRKAAVKLLSRIEPVALLADDFGNVRTHSVDALKELRLDILIEHAPAIVAHLVHYTFSVRVAALEVMKHLDPETLSTYRQAIQAHLDDETEEVRRAALELICLIDGLPMPEQPAPPPESAPAEAAPMADGEDGVAEAPSEERPFTAPVGPPSADERPKEPAVSATPGA